MKTAPLFLFVLGLSAAPLAAQAPATAAPPPELAAYVTKADPSYQWTLKEKVEANGGAMYNLHLVSQTWQTFKWEHELQIFVPKNAKPQKTMLIFNTGGKPNVTGNVLSMAIAERVGAPIAFLWGIPSQPIFDKKEDALIAETFVRYLSTEDSNWPLLFPMAKSLVKSMDAIQAFAKKEWDYEVSHFVVSGASKRGWTSWMTAASGDPRVKAIAPMVIDTLNMQAQMPHQLKSYGAYSVMIQDYVRAKLLPMPDTGTARKLWTMIDPWVYREKLTLPKMIINGSNDPYWTQDALNLYWNDLKGDKYILYVPNAGHDLRETSRYGKKDLLPTRAVDTLAAFVKSQVFDKSMPKLTWNYAEANGETTVSVTSDTPIKKQRLWTAEAETRDFRQSPWTSKELMPGDPKADSTLIATQSAIAKPEKGFKAVFVETEYDFDGVKLNLSTQIQILEAKK